MYTTLTIGQKAFREKVMFTREIIEASPEDFEFCENVCGIATLLFVEGKIKLHTPSINERWRPKRSPRRYIVMKEGKFSAKKLVCTLYLRPELLRKAVGAVCYIVNRRLHISTPKIDCSWLTTGFLVEITKRYLRIPDFILRITRHKRPLWEQFSFTCMINKARRGHHGRLDTASNLWVSIFLF